MDFKGSEAVDSSCGVIIVGVEVGVEVEELVEEEELGGGVLVGNFLFLLVPFGFFFFKYFVLHCGLFFLVTNLQGCLHVFFRGTT